jgi:hypothetical protein
MNQAQVQSGYTENFLDVCYNEESLDMVDELQILPASSAFETRTTRLRDAKINGDTPGHSSMSCSVSFNDLKDYDAKPSFLARTRSPLKKKPVAQFLDPHKHQLACREKALTMRLERGDTKLIFDEAGGQPLVPDTPNLRVGLRVVRGKQWDVADKSDGSLTQAKVGRPAGPNKVARLLVTGIEEDKYNGEYNKTGPLFNGRPHFMNQNGCVFYYNPHHRPADQQNADSFLAGWAFDFRNQPVKGGECLSSCSGGFIECQTASGMYPPIGSLEAMKQSPKKLTWHPQRIHPSIGALAIEDKSHEVRLKDHPEYKQVSPLHCTHYTVLLLYSLHCTHTALTILYSYCTHCTVLILYSLYCTHTVLTILYSYCTHCTVLLLYSLHCTPTVLTALYSYCTHCTVLILYSLYCTPTVLTILYSYCTHTVLILYSLHCTHTVLTALYSYCTHYTVLILYSYCTNSSSPCLL